jgi:hypothetical protein
MIGDKGPNAENFKVVFVARGGTFHLEEWSAASTALTEYSASGWQPMSVLPWAGSGTDGLVLIFRRMTEIGSS